MTYRFKTDLKWSDVTPKSAFLNRRSFMASAGAAALGSIAGPALARIMTVPSQYSTDAAPNTLEEITTYNNYYEFGTGKDEPARYAKALVTDPWSVTIDGLVDNPGTFSLDDLVSGMTIEERIYRFRCVEAWSMVIPWNGFQLSALLDKAGVQSGAKYVSFETVVQPENMIGVQRGVLDFPYREGLRLDEAMNPLTILATGVYNEPLANQSGAPIRLVVPWKYGFKSIKSIVRITLTDTQPYTTWKAINQREYGFYSNVNPNVDHPRWSQASERRIGAGLFAGREDTLMFNGYGDEVASLYADMDLLENY
ncbi:protein-methionine-sulfoxide reductase catalytic subunit MsrP [Pseudogemmobacter sp. W21_MBD1_M6]|uniref:protein-methionine-sulfoxide reductase catalytic subunit MsrP n=1 Tax=Pseudogemmobacter sp. W21_MBD1_M6 TaxID=3240271 RepID=UPI003F972F0D